MTRHRGAVMPAEAPAGPCDALGAARTSPAPSGGASGSQRARSALPSPLELQRLIARAERQPLTPVQALALRNGVEHLAGQVELAGVTIRRLSEELQRARLASPLAVACGHCGVPALSPCRPVHGVAVATPHTARIDAVARLGGVR